MADQIQHLQDQLKDAFAVIDGYGETAAILNNALVRSKADCVLLRKRIAELEAAQPKPNGAAEQKDKEA